VGKINDDTLLGLSGAANYLGCSEAAVLNHANSGGIKCTRDSSGKRLFSIGDLKAYCRANRIGNVGRLQTNDARNTRWPS